MAWLSFILIIAITFYEIAGEGIDDNVKIAIIRREAKLAAAAIRGITIRTPECKVQLASMATDGLVALNHAKYSLNNVVPNLADGEERKELGSRALRMSTVSNELQQTMFGDSEQLKEKLASGLEVLDADLSKQVDFKVENHFARNQQSRARDFRIFSVYKLKLRATLFEKTNKELADEMKEGTVKLSEACAALTTTDQDTDEVLRQMLGHLTVVAARGVFKLQNWVAVNPNKVNEIETVEEVARTLSGLYERLDSVILGNHNTAYLKSELEHIYTDGVKKVNKLARLEYPENTGYQEFIRSVLVDGVTIGRVFAECIKSIGSKAQ